MDILRNVLFVTLIFSMNLKHSFANYPDQIYIDKNSSEKITLPAAFDVKIIGFPYIVDHDKNVINFGKALQLVLTKDLKAYNLSINDKNTAYKYVLAVEMVGYNFGNKVHKLNDTLQPYYSVTGEAHEITSFSEIYIRVSICQASNDVNNIIEKQLAIIPVKIKLENTKFRDGIKLTEYLSMGPYVHPATFEWEKLCYEVSSKVVNILNILLEQENN